MNNSRDDVFSFLGRIIGKNIVDSSNFDRRNDSGVRASFAMLGILAFVGYEAVKITYRKNFGMTPLAWLRFVLCLLCFAGASVASFFWANSTDDFAKGAATPNAHIASGIFFAALTLILLVKGIKGASKTVDKNYNGDSNVLKFLMKEGWSQKKIQYLAEPLLTLVIGLVFCTYNYFAGAAIMFCALSSWASILFEAFFPSHSIDDDANNMNQKHTRKTHFRKAQNA